MYLGKCYIEGSDYIWTSENRNPLNDKIPIAVHTAPLQLDVEPKDP